MYDEGRVSYCGPSNKRGTLRHLSFFYGMPTPLKRMRNLRNSKDSIASKHSARPKPNSKDSVLSDDFAKQAY